MSSEASHAAAEQRALTISKWGNLFMGVAGVLAAWLSNSSAVLVDGLFSLIGFTAAIIGARISARVHLGPDRLRPAGYAADEAIYQTFRALSLVGLVAFAFGNSVLNIVNYARGGEIATLYYPPLYVYFVVICAVCAGMAMVHHAAWRRTGRVSALLGMEAKAAVFDGIMSLVAGLGLAVLPLLKGGPLGWIAPVGDSIIVLFLCSLAVGRYYRDFMDGLAELAGMSARPEVVAETRRTVRKSVDEIGGRLVDLSVMKLGRTNFVQVYFDPERPMTAREVDDVTRRFDSALAGSAARAVSLVIVSEHGRKLVSESD